MKIKPKKHKDKCISYSSEEIQYMRDHPSPSGTCCESLAEYYMRLGKKSKLAKLQDQNTFKW